MRQIKITVDTGFANCDHVDYIDLPDTWDTWPEKEQEKFLNQVRAESLHNYCDAYTEIVGIDE